MNVIRGATSMEHSFSLSNLTCQSLVVFLFSHLQSDTLWISIHAFLFFFFLPWWQCVARRFWVQNRWPGPFYSNWLLHVLPEPGFLPQSKDKHIRLTGDSKVSMNMNVFEYDRCQPCDRLASCSGCPHPPALCDDPSRISGAANRWIFPVKPKPWNKYI